ncbi:ANTAR domain protein with unknown sensor [Desulfarculus baarsii DSM 2075]|uniref:ANTAR domain-containing protein n=1 Tax=Desulfarculus baarsii (strain ATCC 33931 / DSM 2075 / LMG 7858 / VKM B-1802 / 2st14) TaxID=644282 RepID=E1QKL2_DESB2|nr:ANTAR domain-containing protein [Desulfarculus baarsii]ADK86105.1 ANTAR domain protein with unknown sensor [Desulfarculus baarsii DSM 2075]
MAKQHVVLINKPGSPLGRAIDQTLHNDLGLVVWQVSQPPLPKAAEQQSWALWDISGYGPDDARDLAPALAQAQTPVILLCAKVDQAACELLATLREPTPDEPRIIGLVHAPENWADLTTLLRPSLDHLALLREKEAEIERLRQELQDRRVIERAKYALMVARGVDEEQAYAMIRLHSRNTNQRMVDVANKILQLNDKLAGRGD